VFNSMRKAASLRLLALLLAAGLAAALHLSGIEPYLAAERFAHDLRVRLSTRVAQERRVVIVDIDEASLARIGPWPWPRTRIADLVEALAQDYRASLIGLDIVFPDPRPEDGTLRRVLARSPVVLAQVFDPSPDSGNRSGRLADPLPGPARHLAGSTGNSPGSLTGSAPLAGSLPMALPASEAGGFVANHAGFLFPGVRVGHITPTLDGDGKVRRLQAVWCHQGHCAVPLGLRMFMALTGARSLEPVLAAWGGTALRLEPEAGLRLPLGPDGAVLLPYRLAPEALAYVPAADVLSRQAPRELLENALVLVGSTALGLGDRVATPLSSLTPGVAVHAELLSALLDDVAVRDFPYPGWIMAAMGLAWSLLLVAFARQEMHPWRLVAWAVAGLATWGMANLLLWRQLGWAVPVWPVWIFQMTAFALLAPLENRQAWRQLGGLVRQVSSYIPAPVVQRLLGEGRGVAPGLDAEQRLLTVLFADMRGFTTLAEQETPERVALLVQRLLSELSAAVVSHGGTVEKFTGDGLMAIWGAPDPDPEHAPHALQAAAALQERVAALQPWLAGHGFPALRLVVGINTGQAVVGIYGNASHRAYTAHGDAVNVGERIQRLTRDLGISILFGEATAGLLPAGSAAFVGRYPVPGRQEPVAVWCRTEDFPPGPKAESI